MSKIFTIRFRRSERKEDMELELPDVPRIGEFIKLEGTMYLVHAVVWVVENVEGAVYFQRAEVVLISETL